MTLFAGYAFAGTSVKADDKTTRLPYLVNHGDKVELTFAQGTLGTGGATLPCTVVDTSDAWVRCATTDELENPRQQRWYDLKRVVQITKQEK